jgi:hypothetical protein
MEMRTTGPIRFLPVPSPPRYIDPEQSMKKVDCPACLAGLKPVLKMVYWYFLEDKWQMPHAYITVPKESNFSVYMQLTYDRTKKAYPFHTLILVRRGNLFYWKPVGVKDFEVPDSNNA